MGTLPVELVRNVLYDECDDFDSVLAENLQGYDLVDKERELQKLRQKFEAMHSQKPKAPITPSADEEHGMDKVDEPTDETKLA